jgi:hypothetical protein
MHAFSSVLKRLTAISVVALLVVTLGLALMPQHGAAKPPKPPPEDQNQNAILSLMTPKQIFVTGARYNGDLVSAAFGLGGLPFGEGFDGEGLGPFLGGSGLEAADYICQYHAAEAELKGTFKAILSSSTEDANSRISTSLGPYRLVNGTPVAENYAHLFGTREGSNATTPHLPPIELISAVRREADGSDVQGGGPDFLREVWTGSTAMGSVVLTENPGPGAGSPRADLSTCEDWTSSSPAVECIDHSSEGICGVTGFSLKATTEWLDFDDAGCDQERRLYCAEQ